MKVVVVVFAALASASAFAVRSAPVRLVPDAASALWRTYTAGANGIRWEWPEGAASAKLTVSGKDGVVTHVFDTSVSSFAPAAPTDAESEDVCDFELSFYAAAGAGGEAMGGETLSADGIGIVRGVNGAALEVRPVQASSRAWSSMRSKSAVLPISEDFIALTLDGVERDGATPPWHLWSPIARGRDYAWALESVGGDFSAILRRRKTGFMLVID